MTILLRKVSHVRPHTYETRGFYFMCWCKTKNNSCGFTKEKIRFVNPMKGCNAHDLTHHSERPI